MSGGRRSDTERSACGKASHNRVREEIEKPHYSSSFPRKRESIAVFRKEKGADIADGRLWIPAFERVKKSGGSHCDGRIAEVTVL